MSQLGRPDRPLCCGQTLLKSFVESFQKAKADVHKKRSVKKNHAVSVVQCFERVLNGIPPFLLEKKNEVKKSVSLPRPNLTKASKTEHEAMHKVNGNNCQLIRRHYREDFLVIIEHYR